MPDDLLILQKHLRSTSLGQNMKKFINICPKVLRFRGTGCSKVLKQPLADCNEIKQFIEI